MKVGSAPHGRVADIHHLAAGCGYSSLKSRWIQTREAPTALLKQRFVRSAQSRTAEQQHGCGGSSLTVTRWCFSLEVPKPLHLMK